METQRMESRSPADGGGGDAGFRGERLDPPPSPRPLSGRTPDRGGFLLCPLADPIAGLLLWPIAYSPPPRGAPLFPDGAVERN